MHRFVDIHQKKLETYACLQDIKSRKENKDVSTEMYRDAGKSLARPGRKQPTATEYFEFHISYL